MKVGCICGWIGSTQQNEAECPRCLRKGAHRPLHQLIPCHWCGTAKHVQLVGYNLYRCHQCDRSFDNDPSEGSFVATSDDPVRSAIQEEAMQLRAKAAKPPRHRF